MRQFVTLILLLWIWVAPASAQLVEQIDAMADSARALEGAFWGARVVNIDSGEVVYEHNPDSHFVPASNAKLYATALALRRLGPDHRFLTRIVADAEPDAEGVVEGDIRLIGGGDPTLSAREYPYDGDSPSGNALAPIEAFAEELFGKGVRRVSGDIVGDNTAYPWEPYPEGWALDDTFWDYGAPVSALALHDNFFRLSVFPGRSAGEPARLAVRPATEYYRLVNRVRTVAQGETVVEIDWPFGSQEVDVRGTMLLGDGRDRLLAIRDPAHYAAWVLKEALERRGVVVEGEARALYRSADEPPASSDGVVLATRESPPLFEVLQVINKVSQNLHAELMLHEVARVRRGDGSREAGLRELRAFLTAAGVPESAYRLEDGSGLSRLDLVTPAGTAQLLRYMYLSEDRDGWLETLAVGGSDGTLEHRFSGSPGRVRAKTGTMTHVSALSGYADSRSHGTLAFSILVNNYTASDAAIRSFIDRVVGVLLQ